ncbi:Uncharacterized protein DBV15_00562 [Temnothorax longispinosus]|uniref:Uncharacterized protein n=1 Tax=Temnothorax longispinosus TaxID=300112 RepID=A0A4S2KXT9_9HYME|nr:Uncharacterized protein DBV15_00562 [Temnothorax longispinosus]
MQLPRAIKACDGLIYGEEDSTFRAKTCTHGCTRRIAGQGDNGAYGMRLKNVSGSPSAGAHHAWMMHFPRHPLKGRDR